MNVINFLISNWSSVLVVCIFIAFIVYLYIKGEKKIIYKILFFLLTEAEAMYSSGTGALKFAAVLSSIYDKIPKILKLVITETMITKWIEDALVLAKKTWAENAAIENYIKKEDVIVTVAGANMSEKKEDIIITVAGANKE